MLTPDVQTLIKAARDRVQTGKTVPGVIIVPGKHAIVAAADPLELLIVAGKPEDFSDQVVHLLK